jgi:hypothetical protein
MTSGEIDTGKALMALPYAEGTATLNSAPWSGRRRDYVRAAARTHSFNRWQNVQILSSRCQAARFVDDAASGRYNRVDVHVNAP